MSIKELFKNKTSDTGKIVDPENPYLWAQRLWDYQIMKSYNTLKKWQALAIVSMTLLTFAVIFSFYYITQPKLVPYVVTVTPDGEVSYKGVISNQKLTVTDSVVRNYLLRFLRDIRTVSSDVVILKQYLSDAYFISSADCQRQLTQLIQTSQPFEFLKAKKRRDIRITEFGKIAEATWRCEWIEEIREAGVLTDKIVMSGTFTYVTSFPETEIQAEQNPFGLYFSEFYISEKRS
jgi:type IV secretory pathway TrbF-like protein